MTAPVQLAVPGTAAPSRRRWPLWALGALLSVAALLAMAWGLRASDVWPGAAASAIKTCPQQAWPQERDGMVWVPPGTYTPGDVVYLEERSAGPQAVRGLWMDRHEVSNAAFAAFVRATGYVTDAERAPDPWRLPAGAPEDWSRPGALVFSPPARLNARSDPRDWWRYVPGANWRHPLGPGSSIDGREHYPVVAVTLADAQAYANWRGRRLPTEIEWEWAARAAQPQTSAASRLPPPQANTWQGMFPTHDQATDGHAGIAPVGCYSPNALGLNDMIGNVWELTSSVFAAHGQTPSLSPRVQPQAGVVIKGGSFLCSADYCMRYRPGARQAQERDLASNHIGFRTVSDQAPQGGKS